MITVRKAEKTDAPNIAALEQSCIDCPWTESQIAQEIDSDAVFLVATFCGEFCGYVSGEVTCDECEISNIAVEASYRRNGVGRALLEELLADLKSRDVKSVFLLVRDGNVPAVSLYTSLGFIVVGQRKNYYKGRHAQIMRLNL